MAGEKVGEAYIELQARMAKFESQLKSAERLTGRSVGRMQAKFQALAPTLRKVGIGMAVAGGAITGALALAVKGSITFNKEMANIATLIPGATKRVIELKGAIQTMAVDVGKGTADLAQGAYQVISAFGDTADTVAILKISAKAATAGVATTTEAINLLSAVTKGYGDTSKEAVQKASDLAFMTVKLGQTDFPQLQRSMGRVIPLAVEMGVTQEELFAVMATGTGVTGKAAEVSTQLKTAIQSLMAPTGDMIKLLEKEGYASGKAMLADLGLVGSLELIKRKAIESNTPLQKYISSIEGQTIALALTGTQADTYKEKLAAMMDVTDATNIAFKEQTEGINKAGFAFEQAKIRIGVLGQEIGDRLLPMITPLIEKITNLVKRMSDWGKEHPKLSAGIVKFAAVLGPLLIALGALMMILPGIVAIAPMVGAAFTIMTGPIGIIVMAIAAATAAFIYFYKTNEKFRDFIDTAVAGWILVGKVIWEFVKVAGANLKNWANWAVTNIPKAFSEMGANIIAILTNLGSNIGKAVGRFVEIIKHPIKAMKGELEKIDWTPIFEGVKWTVEGIAPLVEMELGKAVQEYKARLEEIEETTATGTKKIADEVEKGVEKIVNKWFEGWAELGEGVKGLTKEITEAEKEAGEKREKAHLMILGQELLREKEQSEKRIAEIKERYKRGKEARKEATEKAEKTHTIILGQEFSREKEQSDKRVAEIKERYEREKKARKEAEEKKEKTHIMILGQELSREKEESDKRVAETKDRYKREKKARAEATEKAEKTHIMILGQELLREKEQSDERVEEVKERYKREKKAREDAQKKKEKTHIMILGEELLREKEQSNERIKEVKSRYEREKKAREEAQAKKEKTHIMILGEELLREKEQSNKRIEESKRAYEGMTTAWAGLGEFWRQLLDKSTGAWLNFVSNLVNYAANIVNALADVISGTKSLGEAIKDLVYSIPVIGGLIEAFVNLGKAVWDWLTGAADEAREIEDALEDITESTGDLEEAFKDVGMSLTGSIADAERAMRGLVQSQEDLATSTRDKLIRELDKYYDWRKLNEMDLTQLLELSAKSRLELEAGMLKEIGDTAEETAAREKAAKIDTLAAIEDAYRKESELIEKKLKMLEIEIKLLMAAALAEQGKLKEAEKLYKEANAELLNLLYTQEELAEMAKELTEKMKRFGREGKEAAKDVREGFKETTVRMTEDMVNAIDEMTRTIGKLPKRINFDVVGHLDMPTIPQVGDQSFTIYGKYRGPSIPSYQMGIPYVPRTTLAELHPREAVLTAPQAEEWRRGERGGGGDIFNVQLDVNIRSLEELKNMTPIQWKRVLDRGLIPGMKLAARERKLSRESVMMTE